MKLYLVPLLILFVVSGGILNAGTLSIDVSNPCHSDVNFIPSLPVMGKKCRITVKVHNHGPAAVGPVQVTLFDKKESIPTIAAGGEAQLLFRYTFQKNGFTDVPVTASCGSETVNCIAQAPVVSRPLYFPWFGGHSEGADSLRWANIVLSHKEEQFSYWRERGVIPCLWKGVSRNVPPETYQKELEKGLGTKTSGPAGIMIDEMGGYSPEEILTADWFKGLELFLKKNPSCFTALWICGSLHYPYCNISKNVYRKQEGIDLLMLECYSNYQVAEFAAHRRMDYFDQRINMARQQDVLSNCVMTLGIDGHADSFDLTSWEIEDEVRYVRRKAPEMPGIGFFHFETKSPELVPVADALCLTYFIRPVIQVYEEDMQLSNPSPKTGEKVRLFCGVRNIGAMDAQKVRCRLFANGKLLTEQEINLPASKSDEIPRPVRVQADFTARKTGYVTFRLEVYPDKDQTVLDGMAERTVFFR